MDTLELSDYWPSLELEGGAQRPRVPYCANEVLVGILSQPLDLVRLACRFPWIEFDPRTFAAAKCHFEDSRMSLLIFDSGRVVVVGGTSVYGTKYALTRLARLLQEDYPGIALHDVSMQNFTCTVDLGYAVDVKRCARESPGRCEIVNEGFPGMHMRPFYAAADAVGFPRAPMLSTVRLIVFPGGNVVCTGARKRAEAWVALNVAEPTLARYSRKRVRLTDQAAELEREAKLAKKEAERLADKALDAIFAKHRL